MRLKPNQRERLNRMLNKAERTGEHQRYRHHLANYGDVITLAQLRGGEILGKWNAITPRKQRMASDSAITPVILPSQLAMDHGSWSSVISLSSIRDSTIN